MNSCNRLLIAQNHCHASPSPRALEPESVTPFDSPKNKIRSCRILQCCVAQYCELLLIKSDATTANIWGKNYKPSHLGTFWSFGRVPV